MKKKTFAQYLRNFELKDLFIEMGWDDFEAELPIEVKDEVFTLEGVAEKRGFAILVCPPYDSGKMPVKSERKQIENKVAKHYFEHLIIFTSQENQEQIWQLAIKEENKPKQVREVTWYKHQDAEILFQRLRNLFFEFDEEDQITIVDVKQRVSENFAKNTEQVTKKFYTEFKKQHTAFLDFIQGIEDHLPDDKNANKQWYASLMLNRLMFCYFIQKKGFLDGDIHYLQNKLQACKQLEGKDNFYNFYRNFLLHLFHDGLGKPEEKRSEDLPLEMGKIPYLNGGLFDVHELEQQFNNINISDEAFQEIFNFFDQWNWHLDNSFEATGRDINPDVIGYIFEKYINDRASMGAYYTKEDITEYIGKNTIIPFLFDETERQYKKAFKPESKIWQFLKDSGDTYIYDAVKHGVPVSGGLFEDLPEDVQQGLRPDLEQEIVKEETSPHLWEIRKTWNRPAPGEIALPTELYREVIDRRKRYAEVKEKIENGEVTHINDFITYNLNIRQFIQDYIENTEDARFIRHFYQSLQKVTILDPTCGSGAFLFAALNILEPLYEACIERMENFVEEETGKHKFFEDTLSEVKSEQHPSFKYFIYKTIILNNLFGVDLMKEAVEIAKLRLFLKLVATVDVNHRKSNLGLEPLPDIDFNIRSGNTLIGFSSEEDLKNAINYDRHGNPKIDYDKAFQKFEEECELVSKAYKHFQNCQLIVDHGSEDFRKAKADLNARLTNLNHKLNEYLAGQYGINKYEELGGNKELFTNENKLQQETKEYKNWLQTHQPFHWFAEFYEIISGKGGFDVIIGNPPYIKENSIAYQIQSKNEDLGNLYAYLQIRSIDLINKNGYNGLIVPISLTSIRSFASLRKKLMNSFKNLYITNHSIRPSSIFNGVAQRVSIVIGFGKGKIANQIFTTYYLRTKMPERLLKNFTYELMSLDKNRGNILPKIGSEIGKKVWKKLNSMKPNFYKAKVNSNNEYATLFFKDYGETYWLFPLKFSPYYTPLKSFKEVYLNSKHIDSVFCSLNSTTHYIFYSAISDCWHFGNWHLNQFPFILDNLKQFKELGKKLENSLKANRKLRYDKRANGHIYEYNIYKTKPIIDEVDSYLAQFYGFTEEELDFIIHYDIKFRMGQELFEEQITPVQEVNQ